jgi:hypothetical protein
MEKTCSQKFAYIFYLFSVCVIWNLANERSSEDDQLRNLLCFTSLNFIIHSNRAMSVSYIIT